MELSNEEVEILSLIKKNENEFIETVNRWHGDHAPEVMTEASGEDDECYIYEKLNEYRNKKVSIEELLKTVLEVDKDLIDSYKEAMEKAKGDEIISGNRLLAEFIGGKLYKNTVILEYGYIPDIYKGVIFFYEELLFHKSMDWLEIVQDKILKYKLPNYSKGEQKKIFLSGPVEVGGRTGYWFVIDRVKPDTGSYKLTESFGETRVEAVWRGCVDAIKAIKKIKEV